MRWIRSMGGPLVLLPHDALQVWRGAYGRDGEDDVDEEETDYWWVGEEVEDYADEVEVRGVSALILANGNSPTTLRLLGSIRWQHETTWVSQSPSHLFDAAAFGGRVGPDDRLDIGLEPGPAPSGPRTPARQRRALGARHDRPPGDHAKAATGEGVAAGVDDDLPAVAALQAVGSLGQTGLLPSTSGH